MSKKIILGLLALIIVGVTAGSIVYLLSPPRQTLTPTGELDFTVSGTSDCLRFLNTSVPTFYVPFTIAANENWQLTINATKMGGGANGWTDVYIYEGYWDGGSDHLCKSGDLYPIINEIKSADFAIRTNQPYNETFGDSTDKSYTVFFVVPPSGQATFHVSLKPA
ncbi:MAG: hypothetical protein ACM3JE_04020 [Betaproteobacteria bacterium]